MNPGFISYIWTQPSIIDAFSKNNQSVLALLDYPGMPASFQYPLSFSFVNETVYPNKWLV
jgi:hypothetical protein